MRHYKPQRSFTTYRYHFVVDDIVGECVEACDQEDCRPGAEVGQHELLEVRSLRFCGDWSDTAQDCSLGG